MFLNSIFVHNVMRLTCFRSYYGKNVLDLTCCLFKNIHMTRKNFLVAAADLPIPNNINILETTRFAPNRSRDISAITPSYTDNISSCTSKQKCENFDKHVHSYDCFNVVNLNSVMQSNVPSPFGGMHKFSHLNMPGGQWSQDCKFMSQKIKDSHYTSLRRNDRSNWTYYQNAPISKIANLNAQCTRSFSYQSDQEQKATKLTKKDLLKKAFKEYGSTVIVFHVAISLISLEICYLLVSGGIDMMPILESFGLAPSNKIAAGASTFVVAYAVHKVFAPIRISITLAVTPFIVRYLRKKGFLKL